MGGAKQIDSRVAKFIFGTAQHCRFQRGFDMAESATPKKKTKYSIPSSNARAGLDKVFMDHDMSNLNSREKVQAARDAARLLANEVDRLRGAKR
jgi:hypothetical protein